MKLIYDTRGRLLTTLLLALCHEWYTISEPLQFNANDDLKNALLKDLALKLDMQAIKSAPNQFWIYHDTYRPKDTKQRNHCYYSCDPDGNDHVQSTSLGKAWFTTIPEEMMDDIRALERATRHKEQRKFPPDVIDLVSVAKNQEAVQCKRRDKEDERAAKRLVVSKTLLLLLVIQNKYYPPSMPFQYY